MKRTPRHGLRPLLALFIALLLTFTAGCSLFDPVVSVGSPSPDVTETTAIPETPVPNTPAPPPPETPDISAAPTPEATEEPNGAGAYTIAADTSESQKTYYSEEADENALRVENGAHVSIDGARVEKRSGDAGSLENTLTYGLNAALLVRAKAELLLINADIISLPLGAGGAFSYGGSLRLQNGGVRATGDSSFGAGAASGGSLFLDEESVSTQGEQSPALFSAADGSLTMQGGMAVTDGAASPAVYAAGSVKADNATLRANHAEAIAVNGGSVTLTDCAVYGRMGDVIRADTLLTPYCVSLTRDMISGGDKSVFSMTRGALSALTGDLFYAEGTSAGIYLEGVALSLGDGRALLRASGGAARTDCAIVAQDQTLTGDIIADDRSSVSLTLRGSSAYTGAVNAENTAAAASVTLENGTVWTLTGNAYLTAFTGRVSAIEPNGFTVYVNGAPLTD